MDSFAGRSLQRLDTFAVGFIPKNILDMPELEYKTKFYFTRNEIVVDTQ